MSFRHVHRPQPKLNRRLPSKSKKLLPSVCGFRTPPLEVDDDPITLLVFEYYDFFLRWLSASVSHQRISLDVINTQLAFLWVRKEFEETFVILGLLEKKRSVQAPKIRKELVNHLERTRKELSPILQEARKRHLSVFPELSENNHPIDRDIFLSVVGGLGLLEPLWSASQERGEGRVFIKDVFKRLMGLYPKPQVMARLNPHGTVFIEGWIEVDLSDFSAGQWADAKLQVASAVFERFSAMGNFQRTWEILEPSETLEDVLLPEKAQMDIRSLCHFCKVALQRGERPRLNLLFVGPPGTGKTMLAKAVARDLGLKVLRITFGQISPQAAPHIVALFMERARAKDCLLLFDECEDLISYNPFIGLSDGWAKTIFENSRCIAVFASNYGVPVGFDRRMDYVLEFKKPNAKLRQIILSKELMALEKSGLITALPDEGVIREVAQKFSVPGGYYAQALKLAIAKSNVNPTNSSQRLISKEALEDALQTFEDISSSHKTDEVREPTLSLDEAKLAPALNERLHAFIKYAKETLTINHLSRLLPQGATALFSGPPGTGKTMVAEAIARQLEIPFRRVSPSSFMSPWFGETEQIIKRVFREAQREKYLLFVDEAEGLFTDRRTDISTIRMTIVNELLQQVESFRGVLIIATNFAEILDPAFARRFLFHMVFDLPKTETRLEIWREWREVLQVDEQILCILAQRFELSGGEIRNIAIKAKAMGLLTLDQLSQLCESASRERTGRMGRPIGIRVG
ncbi:MAG: ATP-binding protein [Deltaproteobacteria bacterium]|nr:ATP-binding protein [Deltaproteobacteria bacterium]